MDKKQYNQMGFDFGDSNPEQDAPAAGFRIKQLKPASNADAGEQEQENNSQEEASEQSGVNASSVPASHQESGENHKPGQSDANSEADTAEQQSENNPQNDSEVIPNTPVTSEAAHSGVPSEEPVQEQQIQAAHPVTEQPEEAVPGIQQEEAPEAEEAAAVNIMIEKEEKEENPAPEAPVKAEKPAETKPNIPSRLTRPTQVYAVEDAQPETPPKTDRNAVFTPATENISKANAVSIAEEQAENGQSPAGKEPDVTEPLAAQQAEIEPAAVESKESELQVDIEPETTEPVVAEPEATTHIAAEPPVSYQTAQQDPEPAEEENEVYYQEAEVETAATPEPEQPKKSTRGRKSLKSLDAEAGYVNIPDDSTLFKRQYYSIGEVAGMFAVNQSLLRFWENEFDVIQPRKNRKGDRHFRPVDIKNLELIYDLLRRRKLTIEGAKEFLKKNKQARERFEMIQSLQQIKGFLLEIKASL